MLDELAGVLNRSKFAELLVTGDSNSLFRTFPRSNPSSPSVLLTAWSSEPAMPSPSAAYP